MEAFRLRKLNSLELRRLPKRKKTAVPGLCKSPPGSILNPMAPLKLVCLLQRQHLAKYLATISKYGLHNVGVVRRQQMEHRLQSPLPDIPLQSAKAEALAIEVTRQSGKAVRRTLAGLE
jgi:hypothetical protein